jgi:uncharacterized lipoprotein YddW (UPF0748 family)
MRRAPSHIRRAHPEWTMKYNKDWWMDPGVPEVRAQAIAVMLDVTRRYDVDGIHIDDYFYPYPITWARTKRRSNSPMRTLTAATRPPAGHWSSRPGGGKMWMRPCRLLYEGIKAAKRHVKFGISPFGLWRPNHPGGHRRRSRSV